MKVNEEINRMKSIMGLSEQTKPLSVQKHGKYLNINGQVYKLQVYKLGGWKNVSVDNIQQTPNGFELKATLGFISQTEIVPQDTVNLIVNNLGSPEINLGGKTPKKLVKL